MIILAIEASTSAAKAMLYKEGKILSMHQINYDHKVGNLKRQNPHELIETIFKCAREFLEKAQTKIDCIALSSVWSSLIILDAERKPITPLSTWADNTFYQRIKELRKEAGLAQLVYDKTGCNLHSKYPIGRFLGFKEKLLQPVDSYYVASLPELLYEAFTKDWAISDLTASGSGFFNLHDKSWDLELLNYVGLKVEQLSPIVSRDTHQLICQEAKHRLGIKEDVLVFIPNGDGGLNHLYEMKFMSPVVSLSIGTSGAIRIHGLAPLLPENRSLWSHYLGYDQYVSGGTISGAGSCISWFLKHQGFGSSLAALESQLPEVDPRKAPIFLPFIFGEQSPGWQDEPRGGFVGSTNNTVVEMYYAVLEGILFNIKQCHLALLEIGVEEAPIIVSGGITNSPYWLQLAADILGRELMVSSMKHASMMGEIGVVLDYFDYELPISRLKLIYKPNSLKMKDLDERYQVYLTYYNAL